MHPLWQRSTRDLAKLAMSRAKILTIEYRWAEGHYDRLPAFAVDLVGRKVDVILTSGGNAPALAAKNATSTIPIVFVTGDPLQVGLVASSVGPGGNLTGVAILAVELTPKRFELLSELVPQARAIALLVNPINLILSALLQRCRKRRAQGGAALGFESRQQK